MFTAKKKIQKEASSRWLSVNELFIVNSTQLSIIKYLRTIEDKREEVVANILRRKFTLSYQLYKMIKYKRYPQSGKSSENVARQELLHKNRVIKLVMETLDTSHLLNKKDLVTEHFKKNSVPSLSIAIKRYIPKKILKYLK